MPVEINVTGDQIVAAQQHLLPNGEAFDEERISFIKNFNTIDLQAAPGSGKTTCLLVKLYALYGSLPLPDGKGVLILSHTNAAIDEITHRLQPLCPDLFKYPNFVGTIQAFVDTFLCSPAYADRYQTKPFRIDDEIYIDAIYVPDPCVAYLDKRQDAVDILFLSRLTKDGTLIYGSGKDFPLKNPDGRSYKALLRMKEGIRERGILCYEEAYLLAEEYLIDRPALKRLLQARFPYVFVDEMQDMDQHQYNILENIFYDNGNSGCKYQRIGDRNQAIFQIGNLSLDQIWVDREDVLSITGSHRLNALVAELVNCFALSRPPGFQVNGLRAGGAKPHLLVYQDDTIGRVIDKFADVLSTLVQQGTIELADDLPIQAIGWIKNREEGDKIGIQDYFSDFDEGAHSSRQDHSSLKGYLENYDEQNASLRSISQGIVRAFLKVLRLENIISPRGRAFTKGSLFDYLRTEHETEYQKFRLAIYQWSLQIARGKRIEVLQLLKIGIRDFVKSIFDKDLVQSVEFVNCDQEDNSTEQESAEDTNIPNTIVRENFKIQVTTVHGAKGQTHAATLYLETYFHKDGHGENAKSYESERLSKQFCLTPITGDEGQRVQQSSRMCYVGLSRPRELLCVAVHKARYDKYLNDIDTDKWEIVEVL